MKFWKNQSIRRKEVSFFLAMVLFGVLKEFLVYNLPIMAVPKGIHDDWIMVHMADALRSGQWLGEYNDLTLTKGMFFPLYLAVLNFLRLSYLSVSALLYTVSCMIFVYALRPPFEEVLGLLYALSGASVEPGVLFGAGVPARVPQQHFLYSGTADLRWPAGPVAQTQRTGEEADSVASDRRSGHGYVLLYPEDAIWVEPFLLVFLLVYLGTMFFSWKKGAQARICGKGSAGAFALPQRLGRRTADCAMENDNHYNIRLTNELQKGGFAEMYKSMMAVKPEEDIPA